MNILQVLALEKKRDMFVDHIARRNEEDESSLSPHQSRASSASGVETDGSKPNKHKSGLRACKSRNHNLCERFSFAM